MADSPADSKPAQDTNALLQQLVSLAKVLTSTTQAISGRVTTIEQLLQQAQHNNTQQAAPSPGAAPTAPTSGISRTQLPRSKNVPQFLGTNTSVPAPPGPPAMSKAKREAEKSTDMLLLADGASVSPAGQKSKLQVSIDRAIKGNLSYPQMAVQLLQRLCTRRGIRNMSTQKSSTILADNLTALDRAMNRSSPFIDDFHAIAQGVCACVVLGCVCGKGSRAFALA